jgi:hypothetical protein
VALDPPFEHLWARVHGLRDAVVAMQLTVVEDRPPDSDIIPVQALGDAVGDLLAAVQDLLVAASDGLGAVRARGEPRAVRDALVRAQEATNQAAQLLAEEVGDPARLGDLDGLARSRRGAWGPWMGGVTEAMDRCRPPLWDVQRALLGCWSELTDRLTDPLAPRATSPAPGP